MIHLHSHSWFSFLASAASPESLAQRAADYGQGALALTDDWSVAGAVRHAGACRAFGIKPLFGAKVTVNASAVDDSNTARRRGRGTSRETAVVTKDGNANSWELVLLCADREGYANLCDLLTLAHRTRLNPQLCLDDLQGCCEGLLALFDPVGQTPLTIVESVAHLRSCFADRLFLELVSWRREGDRQRVRQLQALASSLQLHTVATNAVRHLEPADYVVHDAMTCARLGITVAQSHPARPVNDAAFFCDERELHRRGLPPTALANTKAIARECTVDILPGHVTPPEAYQPPGCPASRYLRQLCVQGFHRRYPGGNPQAVPLLEKELRIIRDLQLDEFFLVVREVVEFARGAGIRCSGRGSAANSLVAYLLGITEVDPIQHRLLFERFLHEGRRGMPDIDVDFDSARRGEVIAWMARRWSESHTAMTANVVTFGLRMAVREMAKALGFPLAQINRATKLLPHVSARHVHAHRKELAVVFGESKALDVLVALVEKLHGCPRHLSLHSGGMILSREPLRYISPIQTSDNGVRQVQFNKDDIEQLGLIKFDVLGLRMLSVISEAESLLDHWHSQQRHSQQRRLRQLARSKAEIGALCPTVLCPTGAGSGNSNGSAPGYDAGYGVEPDAIREPDSDTDSDTPTDTLCDVDNLPPDDPDTYQLIRAGHTLGVFQIESPGQWRLLAMTQPECFDDLVSQVALFRPGPLQGNMVNPFILRRRGLQKVRYPHPSLAPILGDTYGVILFQEQVLEIAHGFAGMSLAEADEFRRLMSKFRSAEEMEAMRCRFVEGAVTTHGVRPELAHHIFDQVSKFVGYGFCRSHAAAFARTVYQSAYLKAHYPAAYMAAVLEHLPGFYPLQTLLEEARRLGVPVLPPCLTRSGIKYQLERVLAPLPADHAQQQATRGTERTPGPSSAGESVIGQVASGQAALGQAAIRVPLSQVREISPETASLIVLERLLGPFASVEDAVERMPFLSVEQWENLARSGALSPFGERRTVLWKVRALARAQGRKQAQNAEQTAQLPLAGQLEMPYLAQLGAAERTAWDFQTQGLSTGPHPIARHRAELSRFGVCPIGDLEKLHGGQRVMVGGLVISRQRPPTARGMTFLTLEDESGRLPAALIPPLYEKFHQALRSPALLIEGKLEQAGIGANNGYRSVLISRLWPLESVVGSTDGGATGHPGENPR